MIDLTNILNRRKQTHGIYTPGMRFVILVSACLTFIGVSENGSGLAIAQVKPIENSSGSAIVQSRNNAHLISASTQIAAIGNEAFTEPFETIKIAAGELGIVSHVKIKRGDAVKPDDLLLELDMSVLEASRKLAVAKANTAARLKAAEVEFESKNDNYEKRLKLLADKAGNPQEVRKAKTELEVARQNIQAIIEEQQQAALETDRIDSQMEQRRIRSPIAGIVVDVLRKPGEYVSNNDPHVATIVQLETLRVVFYLPTARAVKVKKGHSAHLILSETNQHAEGIVEYVAPITNADSGRVRVEVLISNKSYQYRSGVRCRIIETTERPSNANLPRPMSGPLTR